MNVSVFGLGYVGCVSAACLARNGHVVVGVDVNPEKVAMINEARAPIVEPGLAELMQEVVGSGRLRATTEVAVAVAETSLALVCVGTPGTATGRPEYEYIARVGADIGHALVGRVEPFAVVLRSTALPGTTEGVLQKAIQDAMGGRGPHVPIAVNPEFMREGASIHDFDHPPFVLVGCDDTRVAGILRALYADVRAPLVQTTVKTAELVKYACNAYHGLKVCFANEVADLAEVLGADPRAVMRIFALDRKLNISDAYLKPGFAFGGSCLPKDIRGLLWAGRRHDVDTPVLASVLPSNERQIHQAVERVLSLGRRRVGVVGLAFKPNTDDLRESPVVTLVEALIGKGLDVRILDPNVSLARLIGANRRYIETGIPHISSLLCQDADELVRHAEVLVIGSRSPEADAVLAQAGADQLIIDLTRSGAAVSRGTEAREVEVWA
jgi:GDP-mannose 6-dehydrogenase